MSADLTVCYLGNFTRPWCTEMHVAASLEQLGHRVVRLQESETDWPTIPDRCDTEGAHLLLWTRTWPAELDVVRPCLAELRARGVRSVSYHLDRWFGLDREHQVDDQPFFHTDLVVSPDDSPRWAEHGVNHLWMPPGVFGDECERVAGNSGAWPFDVVFVGSYPYPHAEWAPYREQLVGRFTAEFGRRFKVLPTRGRPIRGAALQELYATVPVILGDSCLAGETHRYWSDRIPETLGRGGLLIHPIVDDEWYRPFGAQRAASREWPEARAISDYLGYQLGEFDHAVEHARWALANPDDAREVAEHGRATVLGRDTYRHRMERLLGVVPEQLGPWRDQRPPAPTTRLEIGSGRYPTDGFTHLDLNPAAPGVDIVGPAFPLDLPDGSVHEMRCVDVLEHLSYRDTDQALAEWARVLAPGGRLYVQVPDADTIMHWYVHDPDLLTDDRLPPELPQTALAGAAWRLLGGHADGDQTVEGDDWRLNAHYAVFSEESLNEALERAGFDVESLEVNVHPNLCCWAVRR